MQIYGLITELLRTLYGIIPYIKLVRRGGCAWGRSPSLWLLSAEGWSRSEAGAERGWSFWAWLVALDWREGRGQAQKPSHRGGRGAMELLEFVSLALCVGLEGGKRSKEQAQQSRDSQQLKFLKFLKFLS